MVALCWRQLLFISSLFPPQNFRFSHWFNSRTQTGYSLGKLGCYADSLPDQFSLDMDPGKNPSYKKWRFHAESKPSYVQLFGEERNLNKNLKATMTKMNCSRTRYYLFIHLMDSYKYKYRCITIGHKSPTWLIHPHPAPQKISWKEISREKIPSLIWLNYNSNNLNHTEHSKVYKLTT